MKYWLCLGILLHLTACTTTYTVTIRVEDIAPEKLGNKVPMIDFISVPAEEVDEIRDELKKMEERWFLPTSEARKKYLKAGAPSAETRFKAAR